MMKSSRIAVSLAATFVVAALAAGPAMAQKAPPANKAPAAKTTTAKKKVKKAASPCKGLSQTSCSANKSCAWIKPKKATDKRGRKLKAYCRLVAGIAKKKK